MSACLMMDGWMDDGKLLCYFSLKCIFKGNTTCFYTVECSSYITHAYLCNQPPYSTGEIPFEALIHDCVAHPPQQNINAPVELQLL